MDEQHKLSHKLVDVIDRANKNICVTLLQSRVDKPESSYTQFRFFARKKQDENYEQNFHVKYKLEEFIFLLDIMKSLNDKVITNQLTCNLFKNDFHLFIPHHFSLCSNKGELEQWR